LFRRAALYVDRILKGKKVSDFGSDAAKFDLVINLKTAHALYMPISRQPLFAKRSHRVRAWSLHRTCRFPAHKARRAFNS
jgi:ABC-type uncharacterized transport system substrate-binding protein